MSSKWLDKQKMSLHKQMTDMHASLIILLTTNSSALLVQVHLIQILSFKFGNSLQIP